jgi:Flp pilus assembly protein TadB
MVITIVVSNNVMRKRDIDQMKNLVSGKSMGQTTAATALMKADTPLSRERIAKMVLGHDLNEKVRDSIEQAGLAWDPARTIYLALILAVVGFNIFWYLVPRGEPISILGVIIGAGAPFFYIYQKRKVRPCGTKSPTSKSSAFLTGATRRPWTRTRRGRRLASSWPAFERTDWYRG